MATTTVGNGQTVSNQDETSGNTLDVQAGGTANGTIVENGGTLTIESGGTENNAIIRAGGVETVTGTINGSNVPTQSGVSTGDDIFGTVNVNAPGGGVVKNATIENGGVLNLNIKTSLADTVTVKTGGLLYINGNSPANNITLAGGTLELGSPKADTTNTQAGQPTATGNLTFSGTGGTLKIDAAQTGTNGTTFAQPIAGYAQGDVIDLTYLTATGATLSAPTVNGNNVTLTVTGGGTSGSETFTFQSPTSANFALVPDSGTGVELVIACYRTGTLIATVEGDVAVESLSIGDQVVTASGEARPIRWIGHRAYAGRFANQNPDVLPVCFTAGSLGAGLPVRDLWVSPRHAMAIDGMLVPAECLVDGMGIFKADRVDEVGYWHVELESHDLLLAEGAASESFVEDANRGMFRNAGSFAQLYPDAPEAEAIYCLPRVADGFEVEALRLRLATRRAA